MEKLATALEETILFLRQSEDSFWSSLPVQEIITQLEGEIRKIKSSENIDAKRLGFLFAPTGCIRDTSIDNGWGYKFLELSKIVDEYT